MFLFSSISFVSASVIYVANVLVCWCPFPKSKVMTYPPPNPSLEVIFPIFSLFYSFTSFLFVGVLVWWCHCLYQCVGVSVSRHSQGLDLKLKLWLIHPFISLFGSSFPLCSLMCLLTSISFSNMLVSLSLQRCGCANALSQKVKAWLIHPIIHSLGVFFPLCSLVFPFASIFICWCPSLIVLMPMPMCPSLCNIKYKIITFTRSQKDIKFFPIDLLILLLPCFLTWCFFMFWKKLMDFLFNSSLSNYMQSHLTCPSFRYIKYKFITFFAFTKKGKIVSNWPPYPCINLFSSLCFFMFCKSLWFPCLTHLS